MRLWWVSLTDTKEKWMKDHQNKSSKKWKQIMMINNWNWCKHYWTIWKKKQLIRTEHQLIWSHRWLPNWMKRQKEKKKENEKENLGRENMNNNQRETNSKIKDRALMKMLTNCYNNYSIWETKYQLWKWTKMIRTDQHQLSIWLPVWLTTNPESKD